MHSHAITEATSHAILKPPLSTARAGKGQMKGNRRGMKLGTQIALYIFVFGAIIGIALTLVFSWYTNNSVLAQARLSLRDQAHQAGHFVDALLDSKINLSVSIAAGRPLVAATNLSNKASEGLSEETRSATIQDLDTRWRGTESIQDPFVAQYLENDAAQALLVQMEAHPGTFGEIFLTNRFGALIATTGKLTTLAHGHKPWWLAAFNDGQGAIFLDDRGFDTSVGDYVLGVVVPVRSDDEVIGILKCNFSILPAVEAAMATRDLATDTEILLARSNGLVVYGEGRIPLQSAIPDELLASISEGDAGVIVSEGENATLMAFFEVPWTADSAAADQQFGGTRQSADHSFGNTGESWIVIVSQSVNDILAPARRATMRMALIAVGFVLVMVLAALFLGWRAAKPVRELSIEVLALGSGNLGARMDIKAGGEVGGLVRSFNEMATRLQSTMVSRDELTEEVERRRLVEGALKQERNRAQTYLDVAAVAMIALDKEGRMTLVNRQGAKLLGYSDGELLGRDWFETCLPNRLRQDVRDIYEKLMAGIRDPVEHYENPILTRDGEEKIIAWHNAILHDDEGRIVGTLSSGLDITDQRKAEEDRLAMEAHLRQTQKLESIGTLASGVAHEINSPLMGIINYADLISDEVEDDTVKEYSQVIMKEGDRIAKIVSNLLSFSRQDKETHSPADIKDIIDSSLSLVGSVLRKSQITVELDIPDDLPRVKCRSQQIQQVVINLFTNAHDALNERYPEYDENKLIRITALPFEKGGEDWIRTTIEDHGIGIAEDVVNRIFDPFFTTKPRDRGTGLGLSVSFGIVKEHHGELTVESVPGEYTLFRMDLLINNGWTPQEGSDIEA